ncbi:Sorting nexin, cytoplasm-to-vacuole targeting pathway/endosomal sorting [Tilletia horrida]|uniref:Sorting nexin, cytoplasm-to-vacuole targeting pathway/endosomal sorting n=1 Tax=Tilletia horrida TaxID=155126 RepID=A0AAN6G7X1_9BASI|nr:Sorting nexin, cytoplasm-to-vacuole targeting pathway/endosomal sorting [Tilletia horrida]
MMDAGDSPFPSTGLSRGSAVPVPLQNDNDNDTVAASFEPFSSSTPAPASPFAPAQAPAEQLEHQLPPLPPHDEPHPELASSDEQHQHSQHRDGPAPPYEEAVVSAAHPQPQPQSQSQSPQQQTTTASLSTGPVPDYSTLSIVDALKSSDNTGKTFIVYLIRCGTTDAKRRYSEFEALREALVRLFPCYIVPPIPGKHTLGDYATKPSTAKEDANIIGRRRRLLASFLQRCAAHSVLNRSIVFQRFLDGRFSWHDITMSPPLSLLPKSNLRGPASDPTSTPTPSSLAAYATAPLPAANSSPREPNKRFLDSEAFTNRFAQHLSGSVEKANRKLVKRWTELSADFAELGAVLNVFSFAESGGLASAIERVGQAADTSYMSAGQMLQDWEQHFAEPLQEYVQFAAILQKLLKWRTQKHVQYELALDTLEIKRGQLDEYERIERDALRFDAALARGGRGIVEGSTFAAGGAGAASGSSSRGAASASSAGAPHREEEQAHWRGATASGSAGVGGLSTGGVGTMRRSLYGAAAEDEDGDDVTGAGAAHTGYGASEAEGWASGSGRPSGAGGGAEFEPAPGAVDLIRSSSSSTTNARASASASAAAAAAAARAPGQTRHKGAGNTTGPGGGGSGGILGALSHTFASMMDTNPAGTRLGNIAKLRDTVILLEEAVELLAADLEYATQTIQADLDRFQRQKVVDFKQMMIAFAKAHRELCRQNLESWQAAKAEIARIDTESAMPNSSLTRKEREEDEGIGAGAGAGAGAGGAPLPPPPVPTRDHEDAFGAGTGLGAGAGFGSGTASFSSAGLDAEEGGF